MVEAIRDGGADAVLAASIFHRRELSIGDVVVPPSNLAALLIDSEPQPAAGRQVDGRRRAGISSAMRCTCSGDGITRLSRSTSGSRTPTHGELAMSRSLTAEAKRALR